MMYGRPLDLFPLFCSEDPGPRPWCIVCKPDGQYYVTLFNHRYLVSNDSLVVCSNQPMKTIVDVLYGQLKKKRPETQFLSVVTPRFKRAFSRVAGEITTSFYESNGKTFGFIYLRKRAVNNRKEKKELLISSGGSWLDPIRVLESISKKMKETRNG
jgi:hypothetical protein